MGNVERVLFVFMLLFSFTANLCMAQERMQYKSFADVPAVKWNEIARKTIYFGHQSVGFNIVDGLNSVMQEHPEIHLNILETRQVSDEQGTFAHSRVGGNERPDSKIEDFVNVIEQEIGVIPDAAALKFCYVDVYDGTDVEELFKQYQMAMENLRRNHPELKIIHFTMPLRTQKISWKTRIKALLGKEAWELEDNVSRNKFNELLINAYSGKEPVFDIARLEATAVDGSITNFKYKGEVYLAMDPKFSSDGGHLNSVGAKVIGEHFLLFLANEI